VTNELEMYTDPKCTVKAESPIKWIYQNDGYMISECWVRNESDSDDFFLQELIFSDQAETSISTDVLYPNQVAKVTIRAKIPTSIVELIPEHWFWIHGYFKILPSSKNYKEEG
jgi:hypothetical protein